MITINSRGFDGELRKSWQAELVEERGDLLLLKGVFDREINHQALGLIRSGTISYEYYWLGRWYNVFRFHHPDGRFRNYYCNINMPPRLDGTVLDYVDLDIDILVDDAGNYRVLDEEEYALHAERYSYPDEIRIKVEGTIGELKEMISKAEFPFNLTEQTLPSSVS